MFVDTVTTDIPNRPGMRPSPESLLAMLRETEQAKLRVYLGAAAGVGKTYQMLEDAHQLKQEGIDVVVAAIETHGRAETAEQIGDLEMVPEMHRIPRQHVQGDGSGGRNRPKTFRCHSR